MKKPSYLEKTTTEQIISTMEDKTDSNVANVYYNTPQAWFIFFIAFTGMVVGWGAWYSYGVFLNPLLEEFNWTRAQTTGSTIIFHICHGTLSIILGRLVDKHGPRIIIPCFGTLMGFGYILVSQTESLWHLYIAYGLITGIGSAVIYVPFVTVVSRWFDEHKGLILGLLISATATGMVIQPVAEFLISTYGWRSSYIALGTVLSLIMITTGIILKLPPDSDISGNDQAMKKNDRNSVGGSESSKLPFTAILQNSSSWILFFTYVAGAFCNVMIASHIVLHGIDFKLPPDKAVYLLTIMGVASILGKIMIGMFSDSLGRKKFIIIMMLQMGMSQALLPFAQNISGLYVFAVIFGFAIGGYVPLIPAIIGDLFGLDNVGSVLGFCIFGASIGASIGPVLAGYIFDVNGSYNVAFLIGSGLSLSAGIAAAKLKISSNDKNI